MRKKSENISGITGEDMGSQPINISASRGASILGVSSYKTAIDTWLEIMWVIDPEYCESMKFAKPEPVDNAAIRWGRAFEESVIMLAEEKSGYKIIDREKALFHPKYEYLTCHLDGVYDNTEFIHEGKTTSSMYFYNSFGEPGTDRVPMDYAVQCQHQLICTDAEQVDLSVLVFPKRQDEFEAMGWQIARLDPNLIYEFLYNENTHEEVNIIEWARVFAQIGNFHTYHITPNEKLQSLMLQKYEQFWNVNIIGKQIPEIQTLDDIKKIYTEPKGTVVADEEIERISTERKLIQKEVSEMKKNIDKLKLIEQEYMYRHAGEVIDDETREKTVLLDRSGKKLASYSKTGGIR